MASKQVMAVLSLIVYTHKTEPFNLPSLPDGWVEIPYPEGTNGFAYGVFRNTATNEIVISYRGTDGVSGMMGWDGANNVGLYLGQATSQAMQAAAVYASVLKTHGTDAAGTNISFTGHSLGGGLASVMSVWFDRPATVFDPAPFQATAESVVAVNEVIASLGASAPQAIKDYIPTSAFTFREANVKSYYAVGEFLSAGRTEANTVFSSNEPVMFGSRDVGPFAMHSQALLAAGILSDGFRQATVSAQSSLPLVMSATFYSPDPAGAADRNFLVDLIRSEQGNAGNGKLTHFAADLNKLGTNIAGLNQAAQDALIAQGIEWYYWQGNDYAGQEFFTQTGALLQYTSAQGYTKADGSHLTGAQNKALGFVAKWLDPIVQSEGSYNVAYGYDQWNVVASSTGTAAMAKDGTLSQVFVGGSGADNFTGGTQGDLLLAGAGADTLNGGAGGDYLYGGAGNDTYQLTSGELFDVIRDSDGSGTLTVDGVQLTGGKKAADNYWISDDRQWSYALTSGGDLVVSKGSSLDNITIKNWQASAGKLGISLDNTPAPNTATHTYRGDQHPNLSVGGGYNWNTTSWAADGTLIGGVSELNFNDVIGGSLEADRISGLGGNDALDGGDGADSIEGGTGNDTRGKSRARYLLSTVVALGFLTACGPKKIDWTEEVKLQSGEVLTTHRTALAQPFGQIGGTGGWENEGMTVEIIAPTKPDNPSPWSAKFVPLVFDRDPDAKEWFMVATFYSCTSWYELGRPKLPYTEFRYRKGKWVQQTLSEKLIGREANMLTSIHSSGEPNHTLASKQLLMSDTRIAPEYMRIVAKWDTNC